MCPISASITRRPCSSSRSGPYSGGSRRSPARPPTPGARQQHIRRPCEGGMRGRPAHPMRGRDLAHRPQLVTHQARAELAELGVANVGDDRIRGVGRAARRRPDVMELCGRCGRRQAAIGPEGDVWPCVLSRWMPSAGNIRLQGIGEIVTGRRWRELVATIPDRWPVTAHDPDNRCKPDTEGCLPTCRPSTGDGSDCAPAEIPACQPRFCQPETKR